MSFGFKSPFPVAAWAPPRIEARGRKVDPTQKMQLVRTIEYGDRKIREIDEMIHELQQLKAEMLEFREQFAKLLEEKSGDKKGRGN